MLTTLGEKEARCFARIPYAGRFMYRYRADDHGLAVGADVSRGGLKLMLGRYLRPGTNLMIEAPVTLQDGRGIELKGQIVWCDPRKRDRHFAAGVRIVFDEADAISATSTLVWHAISASGMLEELKQAQAPIAAQSMPLPRDNWSRSVGGHALAGIA